MKKMFLQYLKVLIFALTIYISNSVSVIISASQDSFFEQTLSVEGKQHSRVKRSVENNSINKSLLGVQPISKEKQPLVSQFKLSKSQQQVIVDWAGDKSQVVICVTKDLKQNSSSSTNVYISFDYSKTFVDKTKEFSIAESKSGIINNFFKHDKFSNEFVFTDIVNKYIFVTNDFGRTIFPRKLSFVPSEVKMHPTNSMIFPVMDTKDPERKLWITPDLGLTWYILCRQVVSYEWSKDMAMPYLYVERKEPGNRNIVLKFQDFEPNGDGEFSHEVVIDNVEHFFVEKDFLFAVKQKPRLLGAKIHKETLQLWISYQNGPFLLAHFPNNVTHKDYYIADVSDGQIMVCVFHGEVSNLYVSSFPTSKDEQIRFSLSLERILYFKPNLNFNGTWLNKKGDTPFADLYKVRGVRGVYIASQIVGNSRDLGHISPEHLVSLITFDLGGEWKLLDAPRSDIFGTSIDCDKKKNCSLHISQVLGNLYPVTQSRLILSSKSAPGFILAEGTVGTSLKGHAGLFLSTDAGSNWYKVFDGNYLYAIGDHGGIIVAIKHYRSSSLETNEVLFSIDEGHTWKSHKFVEKPIRVYGLMTETGENTTIFTIFGSEINTNLQWIVITIDFKPVFGGKCTKDGYKIWTPFDPVAGRPCLLGRKEHYERRKPNSKCYNGIDYDNPISSLNCECTRADFECDFGFVSSNSSCIRDKNDVVSPYYVPESCKNPNTTTYMKTSGYRKIPGDSCTGTAKKYEPTRTVCPVKEDMEFFLVSARKNILRYDLLNPEHGLEEFPLKSAEQIISFDFDMKNNCLYWYQMTGTGLIFRQCFDGRNQEIVLDSKITRVEGIALDWISQTLYLSNSDEKAIEIVRISNEFLGGSMRKVIINSTQVDRPRGIALHPVKGYLFFTDWSDEKPMIARAQLDGSKMEILFGKGVVIWPNGITIDRETERLYWVDAKMNYIASSELDGSKMHKILVKNENVEQPYSVGVYKSIMFWDDWSKFQIFQADKRNGWNMVPLSSKPLEGLVDLKVYGHFTQTGSNACGEETNKCQFFCVGKPDNDHVCLCPSWLISVPDGKYTKCICPDGTSPSKPGGCKSSSKSCNSGFLGCDNKYCIPDSLKCNGKDDCGDASDEKDCEKVVCDDSSWQCDNGHCISPDWKCDHENDCGDFSDEKNCNFTKCQSDKFTCENLKCIDQSLVCDLQNDCGDSSDEINCTVPQHHDGGSSCMSLQFQCNQSRVCVPMSWRCDGEYDCDDHSDESDCESHKCGHFYFQCKSKTCIHTTWLCDGDKDCEDGEDEVDCVSHTIGPHGMTTPDPFNSRNRNGSCTMFELRCTDGNCISFWWRCDGTEDCSDGGDERGCEFPDESHITSTSTTPMPSSYKCKQNQMQCFDGECIWEAWICDDEKDCSKGEDEANCSKKDKCPSDHFRCWQTKGCIPAKLRCNGHPDCADASDELGCASVPLKTNTTACPPGLFTCDGGNCIYESKRCDSNIDCLDLTDESNCNTDTAIKVYQATDLTGLSSTNTSLTFEWMLPGTLISDFEFMPSQIVKAALGNPNAWKNATWVSGRMYTFKDLLPYTEYLLKVYVRQKRTGHLFSPAMLLTMKTQEGIPYPPANVNVQQVLNKILVSWDPPHFPNGKILTYELFVSPPYPPNKYETRSSNKIYFMPLTYTNLTIQMTCSNYRFKSPLSAPIYFTPSGVDQKILNLKVIAKTISSATLTWSAINNVDGYQLSYNYPENKYIGKAYEQNVTEPKITLNNLSSGLKYTFKVRAFKGEAIGPISYVEVDTPGDRLPILAGLNFKKIEKKGSSLIVSWQPTEYKEKHTWQYEVTWGKSIADLKNRLNVASTTNISLTVSHLDACSTYIVAAFISGPIGYGPAKQFQVQTDEDSLSAPLKLETKLNNISIDISWFPACPQFKNAKLRYLVKIRETTLNQSSYFDLETKADDIAQTHSVQVSYGGKYEVSIRTFLNNSRSTPASFVNGPAIPPPFELTYNPSDSSLFWRNQKIIPHELIAEKHSYVLNLRRTDSNDKNNPIKIEVGEPPFKLGDQVEKGHIYYATIQFKSKAGYLSEQSQRISIQEPIDGDDILVNSRSMVGVGVFVTVVLVALVALVFFMATRHKRLARSFANFANSHYDRSRGIVSTEHNLGDDDSPMIRGFSDDEPLVIA